jgi:hypothetical protein
MSRVRDLELNPSRIRSSASAASSNIMFLSKYLSAPGGSKYLRRVFLQPNSELYPSPRGHNEAMPPIDKPKNRHRPLRFAVGLASTCALIVAVPIVGPRLMAGSKWDEPDVKPVWKVDEPGSYIRELEWRRDGKQVRYLIESYPNRSPRQGTLTRVVRTWPQMREVARQEVAHGDSGTLSRFRWDQSVEEGWLATEDLRAYERVNSQGLKAEIVSDKELRQRGLSRISIAGTRSYLLLLRHGHLVRSQVLPSIASVQPFLSANGQFVTVLQQTTIEPRSVLDEQIRTLEDVLGYEASSTRALIRRVWRVRDGRWLSPRAIPLSLPLRGREPGGAIWTANFKSYSITPQLFDGSALWMPLAVYRLPKDAQAQLQAARALSKGGFYEKPAGQYTKFQRILGRMRIETEALDDLLLVDALSGRTRRFQPPVPKPIRNGESGFLHAHLQWAPLVLSPDKQLLLGKLSGGGIMDRLEQSNYGGLCVWDFRTGRLLWHRPHREGVFLYHFHFSPNGKMLAYTSSPTGGQRVCPSPLSMRAPARPSGHLSSKRQHASVSKHGGSSGSGRSITERAVSRAFSHRRRLRLCVEDMTDSATSNGRPTRATSSPNICGALSKSGASPICHRASSKYLSPPWEHPNARRFAATTWAEEAPAAPVRDRSKRAVRRHSGGSVCGFVVGRARRRGAGADTAHLEGGRGGTRLEAAA